MQRTIASFGRHRVPLNIDSRIIGIIPIPSS
jgi:hypothetical protein